MLFPLAFLCVVFTTFIAAVAQEADSSSKPPSERFLALQQVAGPLSEASHDLNNLRLELERAGSQQDRDRIQDQLNNQRELVMKLRQNFLDTVGGVEAAEYEGVADSKATFQQQVVDLFQPAVNAIRDATSSPRELDSLRATLEVWKERKRKTDVILDRIEAFKTANSDERLAEEFETARRFWGGQQAKCISEIGVLKGQIQERLSKQRPFWEVLSDLFSDFFRSRGLNLLLALITGVLSFVLVSRLYNKMRRYSPVHRGGRASLTSRISDIMAFVMAVGISLWGVMLVFYVRGDWLLLTLVVLLLLGAAWAAKESIPPYIDQIRTMLNLGSIREGERVLYGGLPWRVKRIGFLTLLENPELQGGEMRIPIRHVIGMISRLPDAKEPWFPTQVDDWVMVADSTYGKVVTQTPEQVVVLQLGGSLKTYPTADFLAQLPENLSHGYRVSCVFGVDYALQKVATNEVPEILQKALTATLYGQFEREDVRSIKVEFMQAGASSLDYQILVDVSGKLGFRYQSLQRLIQKVCVDTCNEHGWVIPFTQITVHQAEAGIQSAQTAAEA